MAGAAVVAATAVSATIKVLLGTVISLATDRTCLVRGFEKELEKLSQFATMIQDFLDDADKKMHSTAVRDWLKQLEEEVFKAEHVLDELNYERLRQEVKDRNQLKKKVCFFFSYINTINLHLNLASKIKEINANLERINHRANDLGLVVQCRTDPALSAAARATTSRLTDSIVVPDVVGRAEDESKIIEMLLHPTERAVSVVPITGMGGIGKTTLAKSVYNNPQIDRHFEKNKFWVCVAREIEIMELFKVILVQLTEEEVKVDDRNVIVKRIGDKLQRKKYFLVLDDVWNHEQGLWNELFTTLVGLNPTKGSWCLVTTRVKPVAESLSRILKMNHSPYFLGKLLDDECWSILRKIVLVGEEVPKELEAIKKQILRKCDGLPLAAKLIGGSLLNNGKEKWQSIVEDSLLNEDQNQIDQILKVSFDHLSPPSVKKSFAYCAIFPQDTELNEEELIEHWIAEGFVLPDRKNNRAMEEIGGECLRILVQNSLLEKVERQWRTCYKMHDLVHDFAKSILNPESSNQDRYLVLTSSKGLIENTTIPALVRTLFLHLESGISADMLSKFKYLHVLKLFGYDGMFSTNTIGNLLHLRLLDISSFGIKSLPKSLCKLYNLQTLTMDKSQLEGGFPKWMSHLISLRHLNYYNRDAKFKMPPYLARLTCFQTLKFFNTSQEKGCGIEEIGTLKYLKGSLEIRNLGLIKCKEAAKQAKLFEKPNLSRLTFDWKGEHRQSDNRAEEDVLEGLQPHKNLHELEIRYFMGNKFPQWLTNLSKLVELRVRNCQRCSELPALGQLPSLKDLELVGLNNIRSIGDEFYGITNESEEEGSSRGSGRSTRRRKFFPTLESLHVRAMKNLKEWKDANQVRSTISEAEVEVFPMLRDFAVQRCKDLRELPEDLFGLNLRLLDIQMCPSLTSLGLNGQKCPLQCLEQCFIVGCDELTAIPDKIFESCTSLQHLSVMYCPNLESFSLNLQETPSLETFKLYDCPKLIPRNFKGFAFATRLTDLSIGSFSSDDSSMDDFDWAGLISALSLRQLWLVRLPHPESLPRQIQYLTTLTSLCLEGLGVEVLPEWIRDLVSLEEIELFCCEKLRSLPSEDALRRLTKLTEVYVYNCPQLRQRYTPQRGIYLEEISSDPASTEQRRRHNDNEQAGRDGDQNSIDRAQTSTSCCFPSLLKKKSSGES